MENFRIDEFVDRPAGLEGRIELNQRFGPEDPFFQAPVDVCRNAFVPDVDEALNVGPILTDQAIPECESVQPSPPIFIASWGPPKGAVRVYPMSGKSTAQEPMPFANRGLSLQLSPQLDDRTDLGEIRRIVLSALRVLRVSSKRIRETA